MTKIEFPPSSLTLQPLTVYLPQMALSIASKPETVNKLRLRSPPPPMDGTALPNTRNPTPETQHLTPEDFPQELAVVDPPHS